MTAPLTWFLAALTVTVTGLHTAKAQPPEAPESSGPHVDLFRPQMLGELNLTDAQRQKLREHRYTHEKRAIQLRSDKAIAELDLMKTMQTYPVHSADLVKHGQKIAAVNNELHKLRLEGLGFFLEQLTPEQHKKFIDLHEDMREHRKKKLERMRDKMGKYGKHDKEHGEDDDFHGKPGHGGKEKK
jgi:Spy/CpxP family protein refolding chaperone